MPFQTKLVDAIIGGAFFGLIAGLSVPAMAEPKIKGYNTYDAMGCMLLRECKKDVKEVFSMLDISSNYEKMEEVTPLAREFTNVLMSLNQMGVKVFLADECYFP